MIKINMTKAKEIAHGHRRKKREIEFAPHDEIIMKQIPGKDKKAAEAAREVIRQKHDRIQVDIDACTDAVALKGLLVDEALI